MHWPKGTLNIDEVWYWVEMDITHYNGNHFLRLIDCGFTWFTIWWCLHWQDTASVISHLKALFYEWSLPAEILTDIDTAFCGKLFRNFLKEWGVWLCLCSAHVPSGNGIIKWCHRTKKNHRQKAVSHIGSRVLAQCHTNGQCITCYCTGQHDLPLLCTVKGDRWNVSTGTWPTANYL